MADFSSLEEGSLVERASGLGALEEAGVAYPVKTYQKLMARCLAGCKALCSSGVRPGALEKVTRC